MKTKILKLTFGALMGALVLTSCYSYTSVVGQGARGNQQITQWNHYVIGGLAPVGVSDSKVMAGGATDYTVFTRMTFVNGLIGGITGGIYTPTTTTVIK